MGSKTRASHRLGGFLTTCTFLVLSTTYGQSTTPSSKTPSATHTPQYVHEPTVVEFDIVFPREGETYAPADIFPIVLAVRNSMPARASRPATTWKLLKVVEDEEPAAQGIDGGPANIRNGDIVPSNFTTGKNPHYFSYKTTILNDTSQEGNEYHLDWIVSYLNCSHPMAYNESDRRTWQKIGPGWEYWYAPLRVRFTIKEDGGMQPNQAALSNTDRCEANNTAAATQYTDAGDAVRFQNEMWVEGNFGAAQVNRSTTHYFPFEMPGIDYHICGNMTNNGSWEDLPANPCLNRIDEKAAASIAAELGLPTGRPAKKAEDDDDSAGYRIAPSALWEVLAGGVGLVAFAM